MLRMLETSGGALVRTTPKLSEEEKTERSCWWDFWGRLRANPAGPLESEVASALAVAARSRTAEMAPEKVMDPAPVTAEDARGRIKKAGNGQKYGGRDGQRSEHSCNGKAGRASTRRLVEASDNSRMEYSFCGPDSDSRIQTLPLKDARRPLQKVADSFFSRFFPLGYPDSVSEGYLVYSQYRAVQHFASAILAVLSTQSLLFAAGLRPTPAQATIVSWVLKDGMQHIGKFICSSMGTQMDSDPKRWRVFADAIYDVGAGLEVISPLCTQHFLTVAGLANMAKGMALVSARATRLSVYSSFAREGNLSDLYAKGEAISTLSNVLGLGIGIRLASTLCSTTQGKLLVAPWLSAIHLYSVVQEMRAAPINTLNSQRTAFLVADFVKTGLVSKPAALRYRERLILPVGLHPESGNVRVGRSLVRVLSKPSVLAQLKSKFPEERFLLHFSDKATDLVLHQSATGEDALRGWLIAAYAHKLACQRGSQSGELNGEQGFGLRKASALQDACERTEKVLQTFLTGLREHGWHTHMFLEGSGYRAVW